MKRRAFIMLAMVGVLLVGDMPLPRTPRKRGEYRMTTVGSRKWAAGHRAGCVFYAPDDECICEQLKDEYERKYGKKLPS